MSGDYKELGIYLVSAPCHWTTQSLTAGPRSTGCAWIGDLTCPDQLQRTTSTFCVLNKGTQKPKHAEKLHGRQKGRSCSLLRGILTALGLVI